MTNGHSFLSSSVFLMLVQTVGDIGFSIAAVLFVARLSDRHPKAISLVIIMSGGVMFGVSAMNVLPGAIDLIGSTLAMQLFSVGFMCILASNTVILSVAVCVRSAFMQRRHVRLIELQTVSAGFSHDHLEEERNRMTHWSKLVVMVCACVLEGAISAVALSDARSPHVRRLILFSSLSTDWAQAVLIHKLASAAAAKRSTTRVSVGALGIWTMTTPLIWLVSTLVSGRLHKGRSVAALEAIMCGIYVYLGVVDILVPELTDAEELADRMNLYDDSEQQLAPRYRTPPMLRGMQAALVIFVRCVIFVVFAWFGSFVV